MPEEKTPAQKAGSAQKAARTTEATTDGPDESGEFDGTTRYDGTIQVERKVGDDWVSVLTDSPRPGDRVEAKSLNVETGELERSSRKTDEGHAAPPRR